MTARKLRRECPHRKYATALSMGNCRHDFLGAFSHAFSDILGTLSNVLGALGYVLGALARGLDTLPNVFA
jgi:hypothetical protein